MWRKFLKDFGFDDEDDVEFLQDAVDTTGALAFSSEIASSGLGAPSTGRNTSELWEKRVEIYGEHIATSAPLRQVRWLGEAGVPRLLLRRRLPPECGGKGHGVVVVRGEREAGGA
ncbi:hypothetical protein CRG98_005902 [Punica granatum]|uniref:Uncharacterized protein n=1 Tax=Punica granatum TaxID=22663 RepID=A0A2I0KYW7_PUNGR|nr:hypothetical protein CRG98_005902 [Punica granatum]